MGTIEDYTAFIGIWRSLVKDNEDDLSLADKMEYDAEFGHLGLKAEELSYRLREMTPPEFENSIDRYNAFWEALESDPWFTGMIIFTEGKLVICFDDHKEKDKRPVIDSFPVDYDNLDFYRPTSYKDNALQFYNLWRYARKHTLHSVPVVFDYWTEDVGDDLE